MKTKMKKINKVLAQGGWKNPDKLFDIKENNYSILILYHTGKIIKGEWHSEFNWVKSKIEGEGIVAWKEYIPQKTLFQKLIERLKK